MLDRLLRGRWHGKESHHSADILNRLELDVVNVITFITETIPSTLSTLVLFAGAFFYLFLMDRTLALLIVMMIPVFMLVSKLYIGRMRQLTRRVRDCDSKVQKVLQETVQNRMLIKTMESDATMVDRLGDTQDELRHHVVRRTLFSVFSNLVLGLGFAGSYLLAFLWAAVRMSAHTLSFGGMTAFLQLVNRIQTPARNLTKLVPAIVSVFTAAERLMELEENPLEEQGEPIQMGTPCGVRFSEVGYAYTQADGKVIDMSEVKDEMFSQPHPGPAGPATRLHRNLHRRQDRPSPLITCHPTPDSPPPLQPGLRAPGQHFAQRNHPRKPQIGQARRH